MASREALSFIPYTLTQGSADAFAQTTIVTGLSGQTRTAYALRELLIEFSAAQGVAAATAHEAGCALTRKSFAAMPTPLEKALVAKFKRVGAQTTSGYVETDGLVRLTWDEDEAPLLVEDPLYGQIDSTNTGLTLIMYCRIGYQPVTISEVDRLTLIANSLS